MMSILKKIREEEEQEEEDSVEDKDVEEEQLQAVLQNIDSLTVDQLPHNLQMQFKRDIIDGKVRVEGWTPWWYSTPMITEVGSNSVRTIPSLPTGPIPPLKSLTAAPPSPFLPFNLVNILYSYAFVDKLFNGDILEVPGEAAGIILELCPVLSSATVFQTMQLAISKSIELSLKPAAVLNNREFSIAVVRDVSLLLGATRLTLAALCQLRTVLNTAEQQQEHKVELRRLKLAAKKTYFFICWVNELDTEQLLNVRDEVAAVHIQLVASLSASTFNTTANTKLT